MGSSKEIVRNKKDDAALDEPPAALIFHADQIGEGDAGRTSQLHDRFKFTTSFAYDQPA